MQWNPYLAFNGQCEAAFKFYERRNLHEISAEGKLMEISKALQSNMVAENVAGVFLPIAATYDRRAQEFGIYFFDLAGARFEGAEYAWGDAFTPGGRHMANTWQGEFPWQSRLEDGFEGTSPVGSFPPNGYGLFDMIGNVWEWTTDWYVPRHPDEVIKACCTPSNPRGPQETDSYDPQQPAIRIPRKVIKGGSHLCAPNYCRRYRPAARFPEPIDTSTSHLGFRCIVRPERAQPRT